MTYTVFHRTWWKHNASWPDGREPCIGKSHFIETVDTEEEAREACREWNRTHPRGPFSDKAEYTEGRLK